MMSGGSRRDFDGHLSVGGDIDSIAVELELQLVHLRDRPIVFDEQHSNRFADSPRARCQLRTLVAERTTTSNHDPCRRSSRRRTSDEIDVARQLGAL
jgi:hypothetical protein